MRIRIRLTVVLGAAAVFAMSGNAAAQSHAHMGHVADGWNDTPDQAGFLATAQAEAEIAARHAGLATSRADDLGWIKTHIGHVLHAIDPSVEASGPGKGYGVVKAATGAARHIGLAANAGDASDNVKLHANHVETSANNVVAWAQRIAELCNEAKGTDDVAAAAELAQQVEELTQAMLSGRDANEDGRVSWGGNEGGLEQAALHMGLMKRGEGMD